jgi:putative DNA primase/helicase
LKGSPALYLNNIPDETRLSSPALEQMASEGTVEVRKLGKHEQGVIDCRYATTAILNGNRITILGALVERTPICDINARIENPGSRTYKNNPIKMVLDDRGKYLAAAFTITRAYMAANRPKVTDRAFAGFDEWSKFVREPLIWLGLPDPLLSIDAARANDPEREAFDARIKAELDAFGCGEGKRFEFSAADIHSKALETRPRGGYSYDREPMYPELLSAFTENNKLMDTTKIGLQLRADLTRVSGGYSLEIGRRMIRRMIRCEPGSVIRSGGAQGGDKQNWRGGGVRGVCGSLSLPQDN